MAMMLKCWRHITDFLFFRKRELDKYKGLFLLEYQDKEKKESSFYNKLISSPLADKRKRKADLEADTDQALAHLYIFLKNKGMRIPSLSRLKACLAKKIPTCGCVTLDYINPTKRQILAFWELNRLYHEPLEKFMKSHDSRDILHQYIKDNAQ